MNMQNDKNELPEYYETGLGKPVIMIPGIEGHKEFWRFQWDEFGALYRTVACSYVRRKPHLSRTVTDYANDYLRLMDALNIQKTILIGESFGGMIAQEITLSHPERIEALVLCNTLASVQYANVGLNMFTLSTLVALITGFSVGINASIKKRVLNWAGKHRGFVYDATPGNTDLADYLIEFGASAGTYAYLDRIIAWQKVNFKDTISNITCPTLILRGTEDRVVPSESIIELVGKIKGAELALIHGGGHCCQHSCPQATNGAILEWLNRKVNVC